MMILERS